MRVDRRVADLRGDRARQQRAQAAMIAAWQALRSDVGIAPVLSDVARFGGGAQLSTCPALGALFAPGAAADELAARFCSAFAGALASEPFGQLPFRHNFDGALSTLLLARSGSARLTLTAQEPGDYAAASVLLSDGARHDAVLAGRACARRTSRAPCGRLDHEEMELRGGDRLTLELRTGALFIQRVDRRLVTLRLHWTAPMSAPTREYALNGGALLAQAAGDVRESRQVMMLALLGRMKRREAAPLMARLACEAGPDALRWEALREALALDSAAGFEALSAVACSATDSLVQPAGALRAQLVEAHPGLLALEDERCPG